MSQDSELSDERPLVRKFVLHGDAEAGQLFAMLKRRKELAKAGKVFQVCVAEYAPNRRLDQNRKMWKAYLEPIAAQARANDHRIRPEDWHMVMKVMFLPEICAAGKEKWHYKPNGDRELAMSTGDLDEDEFEAYMMQMGAYATQELGVLLPANPRDYEDLPKGQ